jgi:hypothetical protein
MEQFSCNSIAHLKAFALPRCLRCLAFCSLVSVSANLSLANTGWLKIHLIQLEGYVSCAVHV